jgi:hypothetical protein
MRSIADQSEAELGGRLSVLRLQRRDHMRLDELLACLSEAPPLEQRKVLLHIYRLVFPHAFAEEAVLWPAIRRVVPNGEQLTLQVEREHQQINELVMLLETMEPAHPERPQLIDEVVLLLGQDVGDEETALLPGLQAQLSIKQLRALGVAWEVVRRIAPTRPHPFVSRRPPGNVLAALPLALFDRSRDAIDVRRYDASGAATPTLDALSAGLRRLSHWVERLPALGVGEDLSTARNGHTRIKGVALLGGMALAAAMVMTGLRRRAAEQPA